MANYKTPGVYIEEVDGFPPSVVGVDTAVPAFIGYTQKALTERNEDLTLKPTKIFSLLEYVTYFGISQPEDNGLSIKIVDNVTLKLDNAGVEVSKELVRRAIEPVFDEAQRSKHIMYYALESYYANGGGPCYIVSVGNYTADNTIQLGNPAATPPVLGLQDGLTALEGEDEPTLIVFPEITSLSAANYATLYKAALDQAEKLKDRFVIIDVRQEAVRPIDDFTAFRAANIGDSLKYGAAYYPFINTVFDYNYNGLNEATVNVVHTEIIPDGTSRPSVGADSMNTNLGALKTSNNQVYQTVKNLLTEIPLRLPPSPAIAGVYTKVDNERGVWKAPANVAVGAVTGPSVKINDNLQDLMNVDATSGRAINAIRYIAGRGTVVWGARTLDSNSNDWRYINVRRFFNYVEESVKKASYRFVFEPNDANTWVNMRAMIENFLSNEWRQGALQGAKPEQAFYVRVGLGQTMTIDDINNGRLIVEIGMAVVRPAEFIILRFTQKAPEA